MMPKTKKVLSMLVFSIVGAISLMIMADAGAIELKKHSFTVGTSLSERTYEEPDIDIKEKGIMCGLEGGYIYHADWEDRFQHLMVKVEGSWNFGEIDYDGYLNDGTPYEIDNADDYLAEARVLAGYDFEEYGEWLLTPFCGFGYRYLNDDLSKDPAGYKRESNYYYSPVGIEVTNTINNSWVVGMKAEYDIFWRGIQKNHITGIDVIENEQDSGYGIRGALIIEKKCGLFDLVFEPFMQYWNIKESDTVNVTIAGNVIGEAYEPANTTTEYGLKVLARF